MPGRIEFEVDFTRPEAQPRARPPRGETLRILVLGDFTGRENRGLSGSMAGRPAVPVDLDTLESVQERFAPELTLPLAPDGPGQRLVFRSIDDFHPEALYQSVPALRALAERRARLQDPATFAEAAAEFRAGQGAAPEAPQAAPKEPDEADGDTLARLLGQAPKSAPRPAPSAVDISAFIRDLVAPHITPAPEPGQALYVQAVDEAIGAQLRMLLHHPDFQALEAAWRGLRQLVTGLDGEQVQVALLDASQTEVAADLASDDPTAAQLYRPLAEPEGGAPWSLLVGLYAFGPEDLMLLERLGGLAAQIGAPFLGAAGDGLLGAGAVAEVADAGPQPLAPEAEKVWQVLRRSPVAPWLGLAWPRLLQRLPYGAGTDPVEGFEFEEQGSEPDPAALLWGSPALTCALLIGRAFEQRGWRMEPGDVAGLDELPAYVYELDGLQRLYPCAEAYFSERVMTAVLARGVMPLMSYRDRNAVRVARFQSVADPAKALAGPWG